MEGRRDVFARRHLSARTPARQGLTILSFGDTGPGARRPGLGHRGRAGLPVKCKTGVVSDSACGHSRARMREAVASGGGAPRALRNADWASASPVS